MHIAYSNYVFRVHEGWKSHNPSWITVIPILSISYIRWAGNFSVGPKYLDLTMAKGSEISKALASVQGGKSSLV